MAKRIAISVVIIAVVLAAGYYVPQYMTKRHSPFEKVTHSKDGLTVTVRYCRPYKKGRVVFGGIVPYGEVWRTGANEATTFDVNKPVMIADEHLDAGRYGLFTIPQKDGWTVIFNSEPDQWGAFDYNSDKDALRVPAVPGPLSQPLEQFTIALEDAPDGTLLRISWDAITVTVPIKPA